MLNSEEIIAAIHGSYATGSKNGFQNVLTLLDKMHVALAHADCPRRRDERQG